MTRDDPSAFAPPPAFGPFRVLHQIGVGVLGPVFRTYEPTRDRLVAVKVFRLDITPEQSQLLADELAKAADAGLFHPSIVEPLAAGVEGTVAYRAEEYVAGESMDAAIRHYAPASLDQALPFLTQLAGAIDFARAAGVGHGALHLRDIFVTPDEARASGFGVVDALERVGLRAPVRRPYSAPERIAGEAWSTPADVFSLAAIAYELLTGRRPAGTGEQIDPLTGDSMGEQAAAIRAVLAHAMDDDPERRYQSALGFASALEAAARGEHVTDALRDMSAISAAAPLTAEIVSETDDAPEQLAVEDVAPPVAEAHILDAEDVADVYVVEEVLQDEAVEEEELEPEAFEPDIVAVAPAAEVDDIPLEDEPAEADYDLGRDEAPDHHAQPATLFDDEAAADLEVEAPATERFAAAFAAADQPVEREPGDAHRLGALPGAEDDDYDTEPDVLTHQPEAERSRIPMLPVALGVVLGLLAGFAGGYAVGSRDTKPAESVAAPAATTPAPATAANQAGKEFSEQAVTPKQAPPSQTAPDVPGDEPAAKPAAAKPAAAKPAAAKAVAAKPVTTKGSIDVRSTPSRAQVTINGKWSGRTPLTLPMKFGEYTVRVVQPGYVTAREQVTISASDPARTLSFRLQAEPAAAARTAAPTAPTAPAASPAPERSGSVTGSVYVDSRPRGATILIDGKPYGTTPSRVPGISIGSHVVRLELADHRAWTASKSVAAGQETVVTGSLERIR
jgi:hypothetical protein